MSEYARLQSALLLFARRGQIICNLGDSLGPDLGYCLPIFLERLRNEITRLTTVKALSLIAASPLKIDIRPILVSTDGGECCITSS